MVLLKPNLRTAKLNFFSFIVFQLTEMHRVEISDFVLKNYDALSQVAF